MKTSLEKAIKIIIKVAQPDKIILFGSRGRGDNTPESDYDILVLKKDIKKSRELTQEIYLNFKNIGAPVDVIVSDLDKYEKSKNDPYLIYYEANNSGRIVYEK
ncbi:MAG: nucleotidyltransferase domain-containing protein [Spirochaetes bacterium]|nr:nucleotidyltransferase domain-containing protein [Spirochaetota bacterium]